MRKFRLPKPSGGYREIWALNRKEKAAYRALIPPLTALCQKLDVHGVMHGFMPGRSPVTNAMAHVGDWEYTVSFDLKDFFDSVDAKHFFRIESDTLKELNGIIFGKGCLPTKQGLPTSPVLANIAFANADWKMMRVAKNVDHRFVYTRYADDMTFSVLTKSHADYLIECVPSAIHVEGFEVNPKKTRVQWRKVGRREITGLMVDRHGVYPTRETRKRLRAARHQNNLSQLAGLEEWCRLRMPGGGVSMRARIKSYRRAWDRASRGGNTVQLLHEENLLKVAAYQHGLDPDEVMRRAHEKI